MQVIASDADPEQIQLAGSHYGENENLQFRQADARDLPFENADFGMVLSLNVFHHIGNWRCVLSEVSRVLKPNGYFVFHDFAYSKLVTIAFGRIVKNYGLYTIGDIIESSRTRGLHIVYKGEPSGIVLVEHSMVFQRNQC